MASKCWFTLVDEAKGRQIVGELDDGGLKWDKGFWESRQLNFNPNKEHLLANVSDDRMYHVCAPTCMAGYFQSDAANRWLGLIARLVLEASFLRHYFSMYGAALRGDAVVATLSRVLLSSLLGQVSQRRSCRARAWRSCRAHAWLCCRARSFAF
jgi:hypothetical protein